MYLLLWLVLVCSVCCLFFFFFKQKTAYEMRISDWSSDVCSSDLVLGAPRHADRRAKAGAERQVGQRLDDMMERRQILPARSRPVQRRRGRRQPAFDAKMTALGRGPHRICGIGHPRFAGSRYIFIVQQTLRWGRNEIGSESCREKVCQYV